METGTAGDRAAGSTNAATERGDGDANDITGVPAQTNGWTNDELEWFDRTEELELASLGSDGVRSEFTTIWVVRVNDAAYVRSADGQDDAWFQQALNAGAGRIRLDGIERDVSIDGPGDLEARFVSGAYQEKYERFGPEMVGTVVSPEAERSTLRLLPSDHNDLASS